MKHAMEHEKFTPPQTIFTINNSLRFLNQVFSKRSLPVPLKTLTKHPNKTPSKTLKLINMPIGYKVLQIFTLRYVHN